MPRSRGIQVRRNPIAAKPDTLRVTPHKARNDPNFSVLQQEWFTIPANPSTLMHATVQTNAWHRVLDIQLDQQLTEFNHSPATGTVIQIVCHDWAISKPASPAFPKPISKDYLSR